MEKHTRRVDHTSYRLVRGDAAPDDFEANGLRVGTGGFTSIDTLPGFCDDIPNDRRKLNMLDALRIHSIQNCANGWQRFEEVSRGHIPPPGDVAT